MNSVLLNFYTGADNVHSIFNKDEKRTNSYWVCGDSFPLLYFPTIHLHPRKDNVSQILFVWITVEMQDEFVGLPAIVPEGPIAIFGLVSHSISEQQMNTLLKFDGSYLVFDEALKTQNGQCLQGGGTAAHLLLDSWPSLKLEGWEIDEIVMPYAFF